MKRFLAIGLMLLTASAHAQFTQGQVLTASGLNAALAAPTITGGTINNAPIGQTTPAAGKFTTLSTSGNVGIGTSAPLSKFHVNFAPLAGPSTRNEILLQSTSGGPVSTGALTGITFNNRSTLVTDGSQNMFSSAGVYGVNLDTQEWGRMMGLAFYTSSQDANATEKMRIDDNGNVGIGTVPSAWNPSYRAIDFNTSSGSVIGDTTSVFLGRNTYKNGSGTWVRKTAGPALLFGLNANGDNTYAWNMASTGNAGDPITWTQAMTLDNSGNLLVGRTFDADNTLGFTAAPGGWFRTVTNGSKNVMTSLAASGTAIEFRYNNGTSSTPVGSITTTTSTTAYNTTSDYRLKTNVKPMRGALDSVMRLHPVTYTWKADGTPGEGFIAHELQEVVPLAVTGKKDAVDADGNPVYQSIDPSKVVGRLTAAIQELKGIVDKQQTEIAALKRQTCRGAAKCASASRPAKRVKVL